MSSRVVLACHSSKGSIETLDPPCTGEFSQSIDRRRFSQIVAQLEDRAVNDQNMRPVAKPLYNRTKICGMAWVICGILHSMQRASRSLNAPLSDARTSLYRASTSVACRT